MKVSQGRGKKKEGSIGFVDQITKILFGTLDSDDANYYTTRINELEQEQEQEQKDFIRIARDQILVIKSAITSFNFIMRDVEKNEKFLEERLMKLTNHDNNLTSNDYAETQSIAMIFEHMLQIERTLKGTREFFNLIIDTVMHAQDGGLQPQLVTPAKLRMIMSNEHPVAGLEFPVNLPSQELLKIVTAHIFLHGNFIVYVLYVP
jgi:hypothetical protein